ncbi:MAG: hypothetical protein PGN07_05970 [Aeromicrobium erythreum]
MSDAPAPLDGPPPGRRRRRRLLLVIALAVVLVLGGAVAGSVVAARAGQERLESYRSQWSIWESSTRNRVFYESTIVPETLYDAKDPTTKAARTDQKIACDGIATSIENLDDAMEQRPALPDDLLATVHPGLRSQAAKADRRNRDSDAAARTVRRALAQVRTDCAWSVRINADSRLRRGVESVTASQKLYVKRGATGFGLVCEAKRCLPLDPAKRRESLELGARGQALLSAWTRSAFSGDCARTSYGPLCSAIRSEAIGLEKPTKACLDGLKEPGEPSQRTIGRCSDLVLAALDAQARISELGQERWPEIKGEKAVAELVDQPDVLLHFLAVTRLEKAYEEVGPKPVDEV